jgi:3-oxoadipate enol-lactonase / 4-carboxymuconolactone decarboxylase
VIPPIVASRLSGAAHRRELPLLVLGPSLGTTAATLWGECARGLTDAFDVVAWDLPGHGHNSARPEEGFTMAELAAGVLVVVDDVLVDRGEPGGSFGYAGDSVGGAVGLQLALDAPERLEGAVLLCTGARIGDPAMWGERVRQVRASGTASLVAPAAERWFGPGFLEREPERGSALLHALQETDDVGYAMVCDALARFDVRDRLGEVDVPVLAVAGCDDVATPPALLRALAEEVPHGEYVELDGAAHLAPAERPEVVARLVRGHLHGEDPEADPAVVAGMAVRREVLGDAHVDRAVAGTTDLTRDFQELITGYAWGTVWTRPGLDRRSRSMITLTALVAGGHDEELALHLRAARRNGLSWEEIREVLLQTAVYCGVPAANTAFRVAQQVLDEEED